jgi:branched-chain amino acid transport system substrate-binding protein
MAAARVIHGIAVGTRGGAWPPAHEREERVMVRFGVKALAGIAAGLVAGAALAAAQGTVKIGVIYPLSGNSAAAGKFSKAGVELMTEIVNNAHPELTGIPLAATAGLPRLKGAKVEPIFSDHQGNPSVGASETVRLITQEKVVAMMGVYHSSVAMSSTAEAERQGIPFVVGDSVAMDITKRGFQWTFRVTPNAQNLADMYSAFLKDVQKLRKVATVAIVNENTDYGTSVAKLVGDAIAAGGFNVVAKVPYTANTTDVQAQVLQLKEKKPDVVIMISYTSDAILFAKTMQSLDYKPAMLIADDAGYSDPSFIKAVGKISQGAFNRSSWSVGPAGSPTALIADMYKKKSGDEMDDTAARQMQGFFVLCDAIDRAGSTDPAKIQAALKATDLKPDQLIMGYKGVKFDDKGQNILAAGVMIQLQDGENYTTVWPKANAQKAPVLPYKGW